MGNNAEKAEEKEREEKKNKKTKTDIHILWIKNPAKGKKKKEASPTYFETNSTIKSKLDYFLPHFKEVFNDYLFLKKSKLDNDITWKGHDGITSFMNINVKHKIIANQYNIILKVY